VPQHIPPVRWLAAVRLCRSQIAGLVLTHSGREQIDNGELLSHLMGHACTKITILINRRWLSRARGKAVSWQELHSIWYIFTMYPGSL
jgi:hypothetical protein